MFDRLIESNSVQAEFKPRRKFFMVSSVVVGILFLSAVVFSLYAQDIDLGTDNFDLVQILSPVETDVPKPELPRQQPQQNDRPAAELPSRQALIARIDQPQEVPPAISTVPNTQMTIPDTGRFKLDPNGAETNGTPGPVGPASGVSGTGSGPEVAATEPARVVEPPPVVKAEPKRPTTISKGVVNGTALELPKPPYPATARAINLTGEVTVQVLIDERGDVVSAKAVSGHIFFKSDAERAARKAKFRPTYLSDEPVRVTGVIVYKFSR